MYIPYKHMQVILKLPNKETSRKTCLNAKEVKKFINDFLFNGIPVCTINTTYSLMSRPETITKLPYKDLVEIIKII